MTEIFIEPKVTAKLLFNKLQMEGVLLLAEVRDAGGHGASRSLDAMSFGLWPSKGSHATGYEIKISRQDWLKELTQIEKAEAFRPYCKYFYLVAAKKVAELHEIPETWGFLEYDGRRLVTIKQAPTNSEFQPFPPTMLSAILKRTDDMARTSAQNAMKEHFDKRNAGLDMEIEERIQSAMRQNKERFEGAQAFLTAIGYDENRSIWGLGNFAKENPNIIELIRDTMAINKNNLSSWDSVTRYAENLVKALEKLEGQKQAAENILKKAREYEEAGKLDANSKRAHP